MAEKVTSVAATAASGAAAAASGAAAAASGAAAAAKTVDPEEAAKAAAASKLKGALGL